MRIIGRDDGGDLNLREREREEKCGGESKSR